MGSHFLTFDPFPVNILSLLNNLYNTLKFEVQAFLGCAQNMLAHSSSQQPHFFAHYQFIIYYSAAPIYR